MNMSLPVTDDRANLTGSGTREVVCLRTFEAKLTQRWTHGETEGVQST